MHSEFKFKKISDRNTQLKEAIKSAKTSKGYVNVPPFQIDIEPTKRCNLNCLFCSRNYWDKTLNPQIDFDINIMPQVEPLFKYCSVSALQGLGEPLLSNHFFDLVALTKKYNIFSMISTNCTKLNEDTIHKILESGLNHITLSIDGVKSLPKLRGIEFNDIKKKVIKLCELKKIRISDSPNLYIEVVLSLLNLDDLSDIISFASELGIQTILIYHPEMYNKKLLKYSFFHDVLRTKKVFLKAKKQALESKINLYLPDLGMKQKINYTSGDNKVNKTFCDYPFQYLMIGNDGRVSPCCIGCVDDNENRIVIGDLKKNDILSIWNGEKMCELRNNMLMMKPSGLCEKCPMKGYSPETYARYLNEPSGQDKEQWI